RVAPRGPGAAGCVRAVAPEPPARTGRARGRERHLDRSQSGLDRAGGGGHHKLHILEAHDADEPCAKQLDNSNIAIGQRPTTRWSFASSAATSPASSRNPSPSSVILRPLLASPPPRP